MLWEGGQSIVRKPLLATGSFCLRQNGLRLYRENKAHAPFSPAPVEAEHKR
jgi:hypothetical protein